MSHHWTQDRHHPVEDWKAEVAADETRLGYWAWVENKKTREEDLKAEES
jgi:hypothetical protein